MHEAILIFISSYILDLLIGDPVYRLHPVRIMGNFASLLERKLYKKGQKKEGIIFTCTNILAFPCIVLLISISLSKITPWLLWAWATFICYSLLAVKDLMVHVKAIFENLSKGDLHGSRSMLKKVVGRDVENLDESGISRAAIETVAENFVDGFLSPTFWYVVGAILGKLSGFNPVVWGIALMVFYKATNTLDSMVGYKNERYKDFGWASARLDDCLNFVPARLSIPFLLLGSLACNLDFRGGLRVAFSDRLKHESPNSAHPESFVSGALGVRLGGPSYYFKRLKEKPWIGQGLKDATPGDIKTAMMLVQISSVFPVLLLVYLI